MNESFEEIQLSPSVVDSFVEKVKEELSPKNVYTFRIGSCVACHSGPTVIGIACLNK